MTAVHPLFPAESQTLSQILHRGGASFGYRIPDYQRPYTWSKPELQRLVDDSLERFSKLAEDESIFNFLGTIILADDQSTESTFTGQSQLVVDGQQRLISLSLTCTVMEQLILDAKRNYQPGSKIKEWIELECRDVVDQLFACTNGAMQSGIDSYFFPRITRATDLRSSMDDRHEYGSDIAKCLWGFTEYHRAAAIRYECPYQPDSEITNAVSQNYAYLLSQLSTYFFNHESRRHRLDLETRRLGKEKFRRRGVKKLLRRGHIIGDTTAVDKAIAQVARSSHGVTLLRIVLFARFLLERLVITKIETNTEEQAFDIFDALNTTGLPLTAVETLKPLVIAFERDAPRLDGVECRERFTIVENYLNDPSWSSSARQAATKDVGIISDIKQDALGTGNRNWIFEAGSLIRSDEQTTGPRPPHLPVLRPSLLGSERYASFLLLYLGFKRDRHSNPANDQPEIAERESSSNHPQTNDSQFAIAEPLNVM